MTEVIVERYPNQPLAEADAREIIEEGNSCREIHRMDWHRSLLSTDGRGMICHLTSPDLESARIALRNARRPMPAEVWACTVRDAVGLTAEDLAQANVLASWRFEAPVALEELQAIDPSGTVCVQNHRVRFLRAFVSSDGRRVLCLWQAADAESVRLALREAQRPVDRVWAFRQFHP